MLLILVETHLCNPGVFAGKFPLVADIASEYLEIAQDLETNFSACKAHMFRLFHRWYAVVLDCYGLVVDCWMKCVHSRLFDRC